MRKDETNEMVKKSILFAVDRISKDIQAHTVDGGSIEEQKARAEVIFTLMKAYWLAK